MGLDVDAAAHRLSFTPHVPGDWTSFGIRNVRVEETSVDLHYAHTLNGLALDVVSTGDCELLFSPAISLRTQILSANANGSTIALHPEVNAIDQHPALQFTVHKGQTHIQVRLRNDFGLSLTSTLPSLGEESQGLRVVSERWTTTHDALTLDVAGRPGRSYNMSVWNPTQVATVEGAELQGKNQPAGWLAVSFPKNATGEYTHQKVVLHFAGKP